MNKLRIFSLLSAFLLVFIPFFTVSAQALTYAPDFDVSAKSAILINQDTGDIIYELNPDTQLPPASLTKIMTAILVLENVEDLYNESAYLKMTLNEMIVGTGLQTGGFWPNDEASIYDILNAMLIQSASECALMLADYVGDGSITHFVDMMNSKAAEIGCTNTNFTNPHGLGDENQYTTARDMAIISEYAMEIPLFREIVAKTSHTFNMLNRNATTTVFTTNQMLSKGYATYYAPSYGIKTGTLDERYLATQATYDGYTYLLILLGVPKLDANGVASRQDFILAADIFDWAFTSFDIRKVVDDGEDLAEIPVKYSLTTDYVRLSTAEELSTLMYKEYDASSVELVPRIPEYLEAPFESDTHIGYVDIMLAEEVIGTVPLVTANSVQADDVLLWLAWLENISHSFMFKFIVVVSVLFILTNIVLISRAVHSKRRNGKYTSNKKRGKANYSL